MAICPPPFKFAGETTSPSAVSAHTFSTASGSRPNMTAIAPCPAGTACCIRRPRSRTTLTASRNASAPAATSALYSPRLWPATQDGSMEYSFCNTRRMAMEAVRIAGWVFSVSFSSSSGPSKQRRESLTFSASSASANVSRAAAKRSQKSFPIPAYCDPWPGKTKASLAFAATLVLFIVDFRRGLAAKFRFHALPDAVPRVGRHRHRAIGLNEQLHDVPVNVVRDGLLRDTDRVLDLLRPRSAVRHDRDAAESQQRRTAVFAIVEPAIRPHERTAAHEIAHAAH